MPGQARAEPGARGGRTVGDEASDGFTLSGTPQLSDAELAAASAHLATEGYVLLKSRLRHDVALDIGRSMLAGHEAAHPAVENPASFQLIFGCFNGDARTWQYMPAHPDPLRVVRSLARCSARRPEPSRASRPGRCPEVARAGSTQTVRKTSTWCRRPSARGALMGSGC